MNETGGNLALPVIAGLAVGIGLIIMFSIATKPSFSMTDDEIRANMRDLPEVQAFYERYTPLEQIWHEGTTTYVEYQIGRTWYFGNDPVYPEHDLTKTLRLIAKVDSFGRTHFEMECGGPITVSWEPTIHDIRTTTCLDNP